METLSQADAMSALDPLFDDIDAICRSAHATYRAYPPSILVEHDARAAANCIYAHMFTEAERRLTARSGVEPVKVRGLNVWVIEQAVAIRFKKMDEDGRSRTYPTKQAKDYDRQLELPGLPSPPVNLVVGYFPDPTGTEIVRVQVARPMGRNLIDWCAAIVPVQDRVVGQPRWVDVTRQPRAL